MAVACARRPPEIEEEHREYEEQQKKASLKIKLNLNQVFMDVMVDWYHSKLKSADRKKLKKRHIVNKANKVALDLKLNFRSLPQNWLRQLHDEHGVEFISIPPALKAKIRARRKLKHAYITREINKFEMEKMTEDVMNGSLPPDAVHIGLSSNPDSVPGKKGPSRVDKGSNLIDLSDEPPPKYWVSAFVNGELLPRVLKVHKLEDTNQTVVYYDYDVNVKREDGRPMGQYMIHEANNFLSWKKSSR